ncbi:MAG: hypothetical protein JWO98_2063 [Frankiales bacterium]|nr:hypothetical protein [Frankiales bacterium]
MTAPTYPDRVSTGADTALPRIYREHDPAVEVRVAQDLIVAVHQAAASNGRREALDRWLVVAYDNDGGYLYTLATVHGAGVSDVVLQAAITAAREIYAQAEGVLAGARRAS